MGSTVDNGPPDDRVLPPETAPPARPKSFLARFQAKYRLDLFAIVWLPFAFLTWKLWFVADDALISFRYARNWAQGHGLCYNVGEQPPVEGYSNFLWVCLSAVFEKLGLDVMVWAPLLAMLCGSVMLFLVLDRLRRRLAINNTLACLAALTLGFSPPFAAWSSSGMETMLFALLVFLTFDRLVLRADSMDIFGGTLAAWLLLLVRAEGFAWVGVLLALSLFSRWLAGQFQGKRFLVLVLLVGAGAFAYFAWRYSYYHALLPNTAHAKGNFPLRYYGRGFDYVATYFLAFLTPFLLFVTSFLALRRSHRAVALPVVAMAWAFPLYSIVVTGDFMTMARLLVPGMVFQTLLLAWALNDLGGSSPVRQWWAAILATGVVVVGVLPGWDAHLVPESIRAKFHFRHNTPLFASEYARWKQQKANTAEWTARGQALKVYAQERGIKNASVVVGGIGATGYFSEMTLYDINGLVTPDIARRPLEPGMPLRSPGHDRKVELIYFLKNEPTFLQAQLIASKDPGDISRQFANFAQQLRDNWPRLNLQRFYVADAAKLSTVNDEGQAQYLFVWRRFEPGTDWQAAWKGVPDLVSRLATGDSVPVLTL